MRYFLEVRLSLFFARFFFETFCIHFPFLCCSHVRFLLPCLSLELFVLFIFAYTYTHLLLHMGTNIRMHMLQQTRRVMSHIKTIILNLPVNFKQLFIR